jgi:hypothetical protein
MAERIPNELLHCTAWCRFPTVDVPHDGRVAVESDEFVYIVDTECAQYQALSLKSLNHRRYFDASSLLATCCSWRPIIAIGCQTRR